jgi:hypothetical protein
MPAPLDLNKYRVPADTERGQYIIVIPMDAVDGKKTYRYISTQFSSGITYKESPLLGDRYNTFESAFTKLEQLKSSRGYYYDHTRSFVAKLPDHFEIERISEDHIDFKKYMVDQIKQKLTREEIAIINELIGDKYK